MANVKTLAFIFFLSVFAAFGCVLLLASVLVASIADALTLGQCGFTRKWGELLNEAVA
jgi:hypothetical protein